MAGCILNLNQVLHVFSFSAGSEFYANPDLFRRRTDFDLIPGLDMYYILGCNFMNMVAIFYSLYFFSIHKICMNSYLLRLQLK